MRKILVFGLLLSLVLVVALAMAGDHSFAGMKKCKMCHQKEKGGMIYETWAESAHAGAYATLATDAAKEAYGKEGNPQEDAECLGCHTTAVGDAKIMVTDGVTCEACHGAGGDYWKKTVMVDHDASVAAGLNADPKAGCVTCHNEKSPTFKGFDFDEYFAKIKHNVPAKQLGFLSVRSLRT